MTNQTQLERFIEWHASVHRTTLALLTQKRKRAALRQFLMVAARATSLRAEFVPALRAVADGPALSLVAQEFEQLVRADRASGLLGFFPKWARGAEERPVLDQPRWLQFDDDSLRAFIRWHAQLHFDMNLLLLTREPKRHLRKLLRYAGWFAPEISMEASVRGFFHPWFWEDFLAGLREGEELSPSPLLCAKADEIALILRDGRRRSAALAL
jgi:hypothetical protein